MREELFVPIVAVAGGRTASTRRSSCANDTEFGLTAGFFIAQAGRDRRVLDRIEAGVVYVNRAAGATTGAWPGVQPFGGWKGSGSTGKNIGGHYTLPVLPARAEPDGGRMTRRGVDDGEAAEAGADQLARQALAAQPITIVTEPPGPLRARR